MVELSFAEDPSCGFTPHSGEISEGKLTKR